MLTHASARRFTPMWRTGLRGAMVIALVALLAGTGLLPVRAATPPEPTYGTAIVDGNPAEWNLTADYFVTLYRAGNPAKPVEGWVYLRYDCASATVYAYALAKEGTWVSTQAQESWIAVDNRNNKVLFNTSGNDGVPPDFAHVMLGGVVRGFEASFSLAPGSYTFILHMNVFDGEMQTAETTGPPPLLLNCELGSIGDYVWHDSDGEGDQDEPPANGLANVRIRLLNGARTQVLAVRATDANGYYLFDKLPAGSYVVDVNEQDVIALYGLPTFTSPPEPHPKNLASGEHYRLADFGYVAPPDRVALGDYVWNDFNSNGLQDFPAESPANAGVQCITIFLYDSANQLIGHTNTDSWGIYMFYGLPAGIYTTRVFVGDPDLAQVETWGVSKTCNLDDGVAEAGTAFGSSRATSPDDHYFTTPAQLTFPVTPAPMVELRFDYGLSTSPLNVRLLSFQAEAQEGYVLVSWETASEVDTMGFNLYRGTAPDGPRQQLNAAIIPAQAPGSTLGAVYTWQDTDVLGGTTYYYWLEDISFSGSTGLNGPVSVVYPSPLAVHLTELAASSTKSPAPLGGLAGAVPAALALLAAAALVRRRSR